MINVRSSGVGMHVALLLLVFILGTFNSCAIKSETVISATIKSISELVMCMPLLYLSRVGFSSSDIWAPKPFQLAPEKSNIVLVAAGPFQELISNWIG